MSTPERPAEDYPVTYRSNAAPTGPFDGLPPLDLWRLFFNRPDGGERPADQIRACSRDWLQATLEEAGVELGQHDREVIGDLADDCASVVQVVAGWIQRARSSHPAPAG